MTYTAMIRALDARDQATRRAEKAENERDDARFEVLGLRAEVKEVKKERDEADRRAAEAENQRDTWKRHHDRVDGQWAKAEREVTKLRAEQPRPLTAEDITDEMVRRASEELRAVDDEGVSLRSTYAAREALIAALTGPPAPTGEPEELAELVRQTELKVAYLKEFSNFLTRQNTA